MKLSIVVITYNQEQFISQTLDSIIRQKCDFEFEIIIGDDCSKDGTRNILASYQKKYPNIIKPIYNERNLGIVLNYFNAISHCTGEYIMECGGDDWFEEDKIMHQIQYLDSNLNIGLCYGLSKIYNHTKQKFEKNILGKAGANFESLLNEDFIPASTICFRRKLFEDYISDINPVEKDWLMEDYPLVLWFSINSEIGFLDEILLNYRVLPNSASHTSDIEKTMAFLDSVNNVKNFFIAKYKRNDFRISESQMKKCWMMANDRKYKRTEIVKELETANDRNEKDSKFRHICNVPILFFLYRLRLYLKGSLS